MSNDPFSPGSASPGGARGGEDPGRRGRRFRRVTLPEEELPPPPAPAPIPSAPELAPPPEGDRRWAEGYNALQRFVKSHGHARVPQSHREESVPLGRWVEVQRERRAGLEAPKKEALSSLPGWAWSQRDVDWELQLAALEAVLQRLGHSRIPERLDEGGLPVGRWAQAQRRAHREGRLPPELHRRIDALPRWRWGLSDAIWDETFSALEAFVRRNGDPQVPAGHREAGLPLHRWVRHQHEQHRQGLLSEERAQRLEALPGWRWPQRMA